LNEADDDVKKEIWDHFIGIQHVFLATVDGDQPRLRPVSLFRIRDRLFFATGAGDAKARQIRQNPRVEFCLLLDEGGKHGTIRAECIAEIVEDWNVKVEAFNAVSFMREFWSSPDDERFVLVELRPSAYEYMRPGSHEAVKIRH
jgi:uncharacterized pyridoxamine 5'-phosphate oxidase family protein